MTPHLDLQTLFWVLNFAYGVSLLFAVALYYGRNKFPGAGLWILAQFLVALSTLDNTFDAVLPFPVLVVLNTAFFTSALVYSHSVRKFQSTKPFWKSVYVAVPVIALGYSLLQEQSVVLQTIFMDIPSGIGYCAVFVLLVLRPAAGSQYAAWITGLPFLLIGLGTFAEAFDAAVDPGFGSPAPDSEIQAALYLVYILSASVSLFGYFLLAGLRVEREAQEKDAALNAQNEALGQLNKTKNLFVAILAHDLREPIEGAAHFLRKKVLGPGNDLTDKRASLEVLASSLDKTHHFLENLLLWGQTQKEEWGLVFEKFELREAVDAATTVMKPQILSKDIRLETYTEKATVFADKNSVELILNNLLSNALKFSPHHGTIEIRVGIRGNSAFVAIDDRGEGPHEESSVSVLSENLGSGLGLILCQEFATLNHGRLDLTTREGEGTTAELLIPLAGTVSPETAEN